MRQKKFTGPDAKVTLLVKRLIKKRRNQLGISMGKLGAMIGVSRKKVEDIETERDYGCFVYPDQLAKLAKALDVPVGYFFDESNLKEQP